MGSLVMQPVSSCRTSCIVFCRTIFPIVFRMAGPVIVGSFMRTVMRKSTHATSWKNSATLSGALLCAVFLPTQSHRLGARVGDGSHY